MLPTTPAGQLGAPSSPRRIGVGGSPSFARAARAHDRTVVNSRRLWSAARRMSACSSGYRCPSLRSIRLSAAATDAGSISSITRCLQSRGAFDHASSSRALADRSERRAGGFPVPAEFRHLSVPEQLMEEAVDDMQLARPDYLVVHVLANRKIQHTEAERREHDGPVRGYGYPPGHDIG